LPTLSCSSVSGMTSSPPLVNEPSRADEPADSVRDTPPVPERVGVAALPVAEPVLDDID
jgi:hypothetical protein